ncbi:MAG: hypothetical protein GY720_01445, partial [bacterium]|nr:hypothetical protein [bacterium]
MTVRAVDLSDQGKGYQDLAVTVTDTVTEPTITSSAAISVAENQISVLTATATNPAGGTLAYSIAGGLDGSLFEIDEETGDLSFKTSPDFESPLDSDADNDYEVRLAATDGFDLGTGYQDLVVTLTDNPSEPSITSASTVAIDENTTAVQTVTFDNPTGGGVTFELSGPDADFFEINSSGELSFTSAPDYESIEGMLRNNVYQVTVEVMNDSDQGRGSRDLEVTVNDVSLGLTQADIDNAGGTLSRDETVIVEGALTFDSDLTIDVEGAFDMRAGASITDSDDTTTHNLTIHAHDFSVVDASFDLKGTLSLKAETLTGASVTIGGSDADHDLTFDGATINAGAVKIEAVSDSLSFGESVLRGDPFEEVVNDLINGLMTLALPVNVSIRSAEASVAIVDSSITSSNGDIEITAAAEADSRVMSLALVPLVFGYRGLGSLSVAVTTADTTSTIDVFGATTLTSTAGSVMLEADATTVSKPFAINVAPAAKRGVSAAVATLTTTSTTKVGPDVAIVASDNVSVGSTATVRGKAWASTSTPNRSTGGVAFALVVDDAVVETTVDGAIIAGGRSTALDVDMTSFGSGTSLPLDTSTSEHGLETGQRVIYRNAANQAIGGLSDAHTYYAIVDPGEPMEVRLADSRAEAHAGEALELSLDDTLGAKHSLTLGHDEVDFDAYSAIANGELSFSAAHGLSTGDPVLYTSMGNPDLAGLAEFTPYYVIRTDDFTIQLAATLNRAEASQPILLQPSLESETHGLIVSAPVSSPFIFDPSDKVDEQNHTIDLGPDHGLSTGDSLRYGVGTIGGLRNGETLIVDSTSGSSVELRRADPIDLDTAGTSSTSTHTLAPEVYVEFDPSDVDLASEVITIVEHGFADLMRVTFLQLGGEGATEADGPENGADYFVEVLTPDTFRLHPTEELVSPVNLEAGSAHVYILAHEADLAAAEYAAFSFNPSIAVDSDLETIAITDHGLQTGDKLFYDTDPTAVEELPGTAHRTWSPEAQQLYLFDTETEVDYDADKIFVGAHNLQTGDVIVYSAGEDVDGAIAGLTADGTYYAIVLDAGFIQLAKTSNVGYDLSLISVDSLSEIPDSGARRVIVAKLGEEDTLHFRVFDTTGARVVDKPETELNDKSAEIETLKAKLTDLWDQGDVPSELRGAIIEAVTSITQSLDLTDDRRIAIHSLQSARTPVDLDTDTIFLPGHNLQEDTEVRYVVVDSQGMAVGNLESGHTYYVRVVNVDNIALTKSPGGQPVDLTSAGTGQIHQLQFETTIPRFDPAIRGLGDGQVYYAVVVDDDTIRLAESLQEASAVETITLDSTVATDSGHQLSPIAGNASDSESGIGIYAELDADDRVLNSQRISISQYEMLYKMGNVGAGSTLRTIAFGLGTFSKQSEKIWAGEENPNFQAGVSGGLAIFDHDVTVSVGGAAILQSGTDIRVDGRIVQKTQIIAQAKTMGLPAGGAGYEGMYAKSSNVAVTLAAGVGRYDNDVRTTIQNGAQLDAAAKLAIRSYLEQRPVAYDWKDTPVLEILVPLTGDSNAPLFTSLLTGNGLLFNWIDSVALATSSAGSLGAAAEDSRAGAFTFVNFINNCHAAIGKQVRINQDPAYWTTSQDVSVEATTRSIHANLTGVYELNLGILDLLSACYTSKLAGVTHRMASPYGVRGKTTGVGATVIVLAFDNTTKAKIDEEAQIRTGATGGLSVEALETMITATVGYTGGKADRFGGSGTFGVLEQDSTTLAQIDAGAMIETGARLNAAGEASDSVLVKADSEMVHFGLYGAFQSANEVSVGVTAGLNFITRDTAALIGNPWDEDASDPPPASSISAAGDIRVEALSRGTVILAAISGSKQGGSQETKVPDPGRLGRGEDRKNRLSVGVGIAGDVEWIEVTDTTRGYVNEDAALIQAGGDLIVTASDSTSSFGLGGAVVVSKGMKTKDGEPPQNKYGLAASIVYNGWTLTTEAFVFGADLVIAGDVRVEAKRPGESFFVALSAALAVNVEQQSDGGTSTDANFTGSVSLNQLDLTTLAYIQAASLDVAGSVVVRATDQSEIIAIGGAVSFGAAIGVGAGFGLNEITSTTTAGVIDSTVFADGGLVVYAKTSAYIFGLGVSAALSLDRDNDVVSVAAMTSINLIDTTTSAEVLGSLVDTTGGNADINVEALNSSLITSIAGSIASNDKWGFGAAIAYNEIDADVMAVIDNTDNNLFSTLVTNGAVTVQADNTAIITSLGASGAMADLSAVASFVINKIIGRIDAHIANSHVTAGDSVTVTAVDHSINVALAGAAALTEHKRAAAGQGGSLKASLGLAAGLNLVAN